MGRGEAPSQRQLRVGETIRRTLAEWLLRGEVHEPALEGASVTVAEVRPTRDLKQATVYIGALGRDDVPDEVLAGLNRAAPRLAGRIARALHLKYAPKLAFALDDRFGEAARIDSLLRAEGAHPDGPAADAPRGEGGGHGA